MYEGLTKKERKIAKHYENQTEEERKKEWDDAEKNGMVVKVNGKMSLSDAFAELDNRKRLVSMRIEPAVVTKLKAKAKRVGIPYQTLAASVLKRYVEGKLNIESA